MDRHCQEIVAESEPPLPPHVLLPYTRSEVYKQYRRLCLSNPNITVPTPKMLNWSDDPSNAIGSEYIITEHAVGIELHQKWPTMLGEQQIACIQAVATNIQQVSEIEFHLSGACILPIPLLTLPQRYS